jgi:hypothetical protein
MIKEAKMFSKEFTNEGIAWEQDMVNRQYREIRDVYQRNENEKKMNEGKANRIIESMIERKQYHAARKSHLERLLRGLPY